MFESTTSLSFIHHDLKAVRKDLVNALADKIVPQLKLLIEAEAKRISTSYEADNVFGEDAAAYELLHALTETLFLGNVPDDGSLLRPHQLTPRHVRAWVDIVD